MNKTLLISLLAGLLATGCRHNHDEGGGHQHGPNGEHMASAVASASPSAEGPDPIARTEFGSRVENFFEFDALKPGQPSQFLIHLTELETGRPIEKAALALVVRGPNGQPLQTVQARVGKVTGIYVAEVSLPKAGTYGIDFEVKSAQVNETMKLSGFEVAAQPSPPPVEPARGPTVAFLMEQQWGIDLKLASAEGRKVAEPLSSTGRIVASANSRAVVSSPVPGKVTGQYMPRLGQKVESEQPVAAVSEVPRAGEEAQVRAAQAQVRAAQAQTEAQLRGQNATLRAQNAEALIANARLQAEQSEVAGQVASTRARLEHARHEAKRAREVYRIQGISEKELRAYEEELLTLTAEHNATVGRQKALGKARPLPQTPLLSEDISRISSAGLGGGLTLVSPLSGTVTKIHKAIGEQVDAGEPILEVAQLDPVWLETPVFESRLGALAPDLEASFSVLSYPDKPFRGTLVDIGSVIDEKTRAATVTFEVPNPQGLLRLGMQASVRLASRSVIEATLVPRSAVLERDGKKTVYVLLSGEEFERREVTVGADFGGKIAITSGLAAGERVVSQGAYQLFLQETDPADAGAHSHET